MENQKQEILLYVESEKRKGRVLAEILANLRVSKSSYYRWLKKTVPNPPSKLHPKAVTPEEKAYIDQIKDSHPHLRHRQIQGMLQLEGVFLSSTSVYKHLKAQGKVEYYERRAAPWKEARYEIYRANVMWGCDWTQLRIGGIRWYLLTLIDFFSRLVIQHNIVPTVNAGNIKALYQAGLDELNLPEDWPLKPELRVDQGSPNTSKVTKGFFKDIQAELSFARARRPTDNAKTERFYRTIKQEQIYLVGDYQDLPTAQEMLGDYIKWYNEKRPHQALWNFTPLMVHEMNNKTELQKILKELKQKTWTKRKEYWLEKKSTKSD